MFFQLILLYSISFCLLASFIKPIYGDCKQGMYVLFNSALAEQLLELLEEVLNSPRAKAKFVQTWCFSRLGRTRWDANVSNTEARNVRSRSNSLPSTFLNS